METLRRDFEVQDASKVRSATVLRLGEVLIRRDVGTELQLYCDISNLASPSLKSNGFSDVLIFVSGRMFHPELNTPCIRLFLFIWGPLQVPLFRPRTVQTLNLCWSLSGGVLYVESSSVGQFLVSW